jgi:hypothetical protein
MPLAGVRMSLPEISNGSFFLPYFRYETSYAGSSQLAYRNIMYSGHVSQMINLYQMLYKERKRLIATSAALQISRPVHYVFGRC